MLDSQASPRAIVAALDEYVIGQEEAKRIVAVAVYAHFRKVARTRGTGAPITKSNVLLIGPSGTGKTLLCETLAKVLDVPFATAEATSIAQARFVNDEIDAILERLIERAGGDLERAGRGIVFIDEIDKLKAPAGQPRSVSGESVQHALLKIMEGAQVKLDNGRYLDTTHMLFICGGAFVGLDEIRSLSHNYGFIATMRGENQKILDRLNARVKPTDLFTFGLIPEFTGRLPIIARFSELDRDKLVRIMTEPKDSIHAQMREIFANESVELVVARRVFEQIADLALEYKTGARSLRGIFEELVTPVLFVVPDDRTIERVEIDSLFAEPRLVRRAARSAD
ncbi:MAG TPA: AAA family ATPase [Casimicrobiaceae bacterium]|nr:AAA family ATPase [Casimicrobiaceae bacterium]